MKVLRVETTMDYLRVLALRAECFLQVKKVFPDATPETMASADEGEVYALMEGDVMAGTVSIRIPKASTVIESVDGGLGYYPASFPAKTEVIEVAKLCVAKPFRGTKVVRRIFELVHRRLVETGRSHILIVSDEFLRKRYKLIGFRTTGFSFSRKKGPAARLHIMMTKQMRLGVYGLHVGPLRWNWFLRDISRTLVAEGKLQRHWFTRLIFKMYEAFAPIAAFLEQYA